MAQISGRKFGRGLLCSKTTICYTLQVTASLQHQEVIQHENPEAFSLKKYTALLALKELFYHGRTVSSKQSHSGSKRDEKKKIEQ